MASRLAKGLFQRAIGESGGLFEPLQLAPKYLLANAEREGEKYGVSLGASSLQQLRRLPAVLLTGNDDGIVHPVIEPYVLPVLPYEAFTSEQQNDVPLLIGSNAEEARSLTDVNHVKATTFGMDLEHSFGQLPAPLVAAYPHATDEEARQARLDLERDLRFGWDMWAWARLQAGTGQNSVYYYSFRQQPPFPHGQCTRVGALATTPSSGMSSTIWTRNLGAGARRVERWPRRYPPTGSISRGRAIRTAKAFPRGQRSPTRIVRFYISAIRSPLVEWRISMACASSMPFTHPCVASHLLQWQRPSPRGALE
jgi:hypothetical protein